MQKIVDDKCIDQYLKLVLMENIKGKAFFEKIKNNSNSSRNFLNSKDWIEKLWVNEFENAPFKRFKDGGCVNRTE